MFSQGYIIKQMFMSRGFFLIRFPMEDLCAWNLQISRAKLEQMDTDLMHDLAKIKRPHKSDLYLSGPTEKSPAMNCFQSFLQWSFIVGIACSLALQSHAQTADTTWVQTFTWEEQNNPATNYESPGRRWFDFPSSNNDTAYQKVLMYHTLKCFEDGTAGGLGYACGEWDYLTYNYLFDHTGLLDSNLLTHPRWLVDDLPFIADTLIYVPASGTVSDTIRAAYELIQLDGVESIVEESDGSMAWLDAMTGAVSLSQTARYQWLWRGSELASLGWLDSTSSGFELPVLTELSEQRDGAQWTAYWTSEDSLGGFWNGASAAMSGVSDPDNPGRFVWNAPLVWDGESHLILELQLNEAIWNDAVSVDVPTVYAPDQTWRASSAGHFIRFDGNDRFEVDALALDGIGEEITVEFWQRGNAEFQPEVNSICEGFNALNERELNVHLPWSNGRVYWDAGYDGGYDRIDKAAAPENYKGQWNHWAFVKDATEGKMSIYLNGSLWHAGLELDNSFGEMVRFHIGCNGNGGNDYRGDVDEFRIWSVALDVETVKEWMGQTPNVNHPEFTQLKAHFDWESAGGYQTEGIGASGFFHGNAGRVAHRGADAFMNQGPMPDAARPVLTWLNGTPISYETVEVDRAVPVPPMSISEWAVDGNGVNWINLDYAWPHDAVMETRWASGELIASYPVLGESVILVNDTLEYFSPAFEVVDRYELARYITPYGINLTLGDDGWTWVFDVTDFMGLLRDSVQLEAGNWQELLDLRFAFIEGTPARDVKRVEAFWKGQYSLSTFDENVTDYVFTPEAGESMFKLKTRASGHGFGTGNNCGEFCYNAHSVKVNGEPQWTWEVMRECADNPLYPQGGTWIYDRAAWCPGAPVDTKEFELTGVVDSSQPFSVDYDITYDPYGNYRFEGQVVAYGEPNMQQDVEISEVLAPSDDKLQSRFNPICESPQVVIRNNGAETLTSCTFTYGIQGGESYVYQWAGELAFLESEVVDLPYLDPALTEGDDEALLVFEVAVDAPNGQLDQEVRNNATSSQFHRVPTWSYPDLDDNRIIVWTKTNLTPSETTIEITDEAGNVVWERGYSEANATFRDTLALNEGCYRMTIYDVGDDGQSFWANNDGSGYTRVKKVQGGNFINFEPDFGKSISQAFFFQTNIVGIEEPEMTKPIGMHVFPNPSPAQFNVRLDGWQPGQPASWTLRDAMGRLVDQGSKRMSQGELLVLQLGAFQDGTYALTLTHESGEETTRWIQLSHQ
jgi:hypothetical protein